MSQYITTTGLEKTMQSFLNKLKEWLPFKKSINEDQIDIVSFPSKIEYKNTLELHSDGKIYILGTNNEPEHLQSSLDKKGTTFVDNSENALFFVTEDNKGRFLYIITGNEVYPSGLYIIGTDASNHGAPILIRIGTTTGVEDLETRVQILEDWKNGGMLESGDIMDIIDPDNDSE